MSDLDLLTTEDLQPSSLEKKEPAKAWTIQWRCMITDSYTCLRCGGKKNFQMGDVVVAHCSDWPSADLAETAALEVLDKARAEGFEYIKPVPRP